MTKEMVSYLENIKKSKFDFSTTHNEQLLETLIEHIGHEDPYVRDNLVYEILAHLFYDQILDEKTLGYYLELLISDDYLFYDIHNESNLSVLKRSFTLLQLVILVRVHIRDGIIDHKLITKTFEKFIAYFHKEHILIGYDQKLGWIHTVAHSADLIKVFMQVPWFKQLHIEKMFNEISQKMKNHEHDYRFNEDERMADALKVGFKRQLLSQTFVEKWLTELFTMDNNYPLPDDIIIKNNVKHLLRSLYFKCVNDNDLKDLTKKLQILLTK